HRGSSCNPLLLDTTPSANFGFDPSTEVRGYPTVVTRSPSLTPLEDANWYGSSGQVVASFVESVTRKIAKSFTTSLITTSALAAPVQPGKATLKFFPSATTCQLVATRPLRLSRNAVPEAPPFAEGVLADSSATFGHTRTRRRSNGPLGVAIEPCNIELCSRVRVVPAGFLFAMK